MNEQITELWRQAAQHVNLMDQPRHEQFAELIIRECGPQVQHVYKQGGGTLDETIFAHFNLHIQ